MSIRAAIFDYGLVLCHQDPDRHADLVRITGLDPAAFERHYWRDRHSYDLGRVDGAGFWQEFGEDAGLAFTPAQMDALVENDTLMWAALNRTMLAWVTALQQAGLRTGILSNMGPDLLRYMRSSPDFAWLGGFDHLTWSCELGIAKPDAAIYTHTCEGLGVQPQEAIFLDDKPENIRAAQATGLHALLFSTAGQLRCDLAERGWLQSYPQPGGVEHSASDGLNTMVAAL